ncbi:hypothetical protein [Chryseobacterium koreense]|uniref:DUF3311 domain-containing protein n=1 Tax=Chryseobacterium koreense CCUG 49689 TaxID=1304281 RepID=A0A0J7IYA7_9FLAO|nr:hypothetical protein [Chryseobacterium koreense]KMQ70987.1 hypothetical protein ACM44_09555 [Chryseobacterium koreense CCUG 49689]MBB5332486.1 putative membrane protein [Chryseobacterium koreense]
MKKRHKQKLVILSIILFLMFNVPLLLLFNSSEHFWGFPIIYVYLFSVWFIGIAISFIVFKTTDE